MTAPARRGEEGQATVELALTLPVVVLLLLALVQVAVVLHDQLLVTHAVRAAAREAAVDDRPAEVRRAALAAAPALKPDRLSTETSSKGGSPSMVTVEVSYRSETRVPLVGTLLPTLRLVERTTIRDESDT